MNRLLTTLGGVLGSMWLITAIAGAAPEGNVADLEKDNPLRPLPEIPLGLTDRFDSLPIKDQPTPDKVRLGRWLFFDKRLSKDNTISCATCHLPEHAFSEPTPVSTGIAGQKGGRKAPLIINQAWTIFPHFFWDGRAASLEEQAKGPIANPIEMGNTHEAVVTTISGVKGYRQYFTQAFGDDEVTIDRLVQAIAAYERTRLSGNSAWDKWRADPDPGDKELERELERNANDDEYGDEYGDEEDNGDRPKKTFTDGKYVSAKVKLGHSLFFGKAECNQCHFGPNFTDSRFHNLGVGWDPKNRTYKDEGRYAVTKVIDDMGAFKTPTLREVSSHAPYMHDGTVKTLRDVIVLYNKGGEKNPHLSPKIQPLNLSQEEIDTLVEFLKALDGEGYMDEEPKLFPQ